MRRLTGSVGCGFSDDRELESPFPLRHLLTSGLAGQSRERADGDSDQYSMYRGSRTECVVRRRETREAVESGLRALRTSVTVRLKTLKNSQ